MRNLRKKQLSRYILATLTVGMFGLVPVAYALPVQDTTHTNTTGTAINTATANQMGITGTAANNVMNWKTFSIANGEKVQFDEKNYLNLVRGASKSEINGALTGGGTIYLINPNGILFGATAQVNVGNLVASTRAIDKVDQSVFSGGGNPLVTAVTTAAGDIINLGKLQTTSLVLEGNNITIQNAADITSNGSTPLTSAVTAKAAGIITVGHKVTETTTRSFVINGTATDKTVHDYKNAKVASSEYTGKKLDGTTDNAVKESMLVENVYDLQNMDAKLSGNYMLSGDIVASETSSWSDAGTTNGAGFSPVGNWSSKFTGSFDGAGRTISDLTINRSSTEEVGLFGYSTGTIQNVGLVGGSITGLDNTGGVAGYNSNGTITNVYNTGAVSGTKYVGGVVGDNSGTVTNVYNTGAVSGTGKNVGGVAGYNRGTITKVYNTGAVSGTGKNVGGVAGYNGNGTITNVYNTGAVSGTGDYVGGVAGYNDNGTITNVYNTGAVSGDYYVGGVVGDNSGTVTNAYNTGAVSGTDEYVGGVLGGNYNGTTTNTWYATTNAADNTINTTTTTVTYNNIGTAKKLAELQDMALTGDTGYGFDTTIWRTNATDGSTALVATTPMLQAFINKDLDSQITHTAVQYGTAEKPLVNIYQTTGAVTIDYASLSLPGNVGAYIMGNDLTINNFAPGAGDTSSWGSGTNLTLKNNNGFTINKNMELLGTTGITMSAKDSSTGTIIDYGKNTTPTLAITAKDIVLDTDLVNTAAGGQTTVTMTAAGTAKAGYTPTGTMAATVNGASVSVPDYAHATKRTYYPTITATGGATLSEGQWIKNVTELQAMGTSATALSRNYFLYGDIDASATKSWNQDTTDTSVYQGFVPVGNDTTMFSGTFDGLNHTINGLTINRSATDKVGLFGKSHGSIQNVGLVGGSITGQQYVGGVVGEIYSDGAITNVYNTGAVSGTSFFVGGLVGHNYEGTITNAYNTGAVSGDYYVGGVAGHNEGTITNVYNTAAVSGSYYVGGVAGYNRGTITNVYNTGAVKGNDFVGGVVGNNDNGTITNALWANDLSYETETGKSKPTKAVGNVNNSDKGETLAKMKQAATYESWTGTNAVSSTGGAGTAWRIYEGNTTPLLTSFFKGVITVTGLSNQSVTYNGTTQKADLSGATYDSADIDASHILAGSGRNAGTYSAIYSDQQGYDLVDSDNHTLTISPKTLTATLTGKTGDTYVFTKAYDGGMVVKQALGNNYTFAAGDVISGDVVSIAANSNGSYTTKGAGDDKAITFSSIALTGADAGNYTIAGTLSGNVGQITKKDITASLNALSGSYVFTKTYDGGTDVKQALDNNYSFATGDIENVDAGKVSLTAGTGTYTDKNVGNTKEVTFGGLVLGGDEAGNYNLTTTSLTGNVGQITKKDLVAMLIGTNSFSKTYDGADNVTTALTKGTNYQFTGMVDKDDLELTGTGKYNDKKVGSDKAVVFTELGLTGDDAGNYNLTADALGIGGGQITAKELTITLAGNNTFTKVYDGTTAVTQKLAGNYTISGIVGSEQVDVADSATASGTYADKNAADGKLVQFTVSGLTGADKDNYSLKSTTLTGNVGKITKKSLVAELNNGASFAKVYDGTTAVNTALVLNSNYAFAEGDVVTGDTVSIDAAKASGTYDSKDVGSNKQVNFTNLALTGADAGNYELLNIEMGITGAGITPKTLTGSLASGYSFDKVYDGTTTASLGNGYTLSGVVAGDKVPLTAAKGFYDSSAIGDRTVTFSGFSINDGNYLLSMADSLSGTGKITSGSQAHNYSDALTGVSSFFGANPSDGYTIFSGTPEDYIPRAVTKNNGQSYQVGVTQVTQTWYNGPTTITIVNGGITLPKDILLGSTYDTRTVVIKGDESYQI